MRLLTTGFKAAFVTNMNMLPSNNRIIEITPIVD
jgi:hypothetical protein